MEIPILLTAAYPHLSYIDDEKGKIFVGGLSWDTTHTSLLEYFSKFGEVVDCVVMKNQITGKSRGFGFVKFKDSSVVNDVMSSGPHYIDGRQVDPKVCNPRSQNFGGKSAENSRKKIFVGGLPPSCDEAQLREVFRRYGQVDEATIMYDQEKNKSRGFGFLTFTDEESVDRVCNDHYITINGKQVEVKRAEPRVIKSIADTANRLWSSALYLSNQSVPQYPFGCTMPTAAPDYQLATVPALSSVPCSATSVQAPASVTENSSDSNSGSTSSSPAPALTAQDIPPPAAKAPLPTILCAPPFFPGQACPIPLSQYTSPFNGFYYIPADPLQNSNPLTPGLMAVPVPPQGMAVSKGANNFVNGSDAQSSQPLGGQPLVTYSGLALSGQWQPTPAKLFMLILTTQHVDSCVTDVFKPFDQFYDSVYDTCY